MSKAIITVLAALALLTLVLPASAAQYQFVPSDADLWDLDHGYYYSWGIRWSIPAGECITEATLFIDNIDDWTKESNDHLYIHLLDSPQTGVKRWSDNEHGGDNWAGNPLIADWSDTNTWEEDLTFNLSNKPGMLDTLTSYIGNNGVVGLGFDPDCHYYNCGVKFTITTQSIPTPPVPEPSSLLGLALGIFPLAGAARRLRRSA